MAVLEQRLPDALGDAAVDLAVDDQRVDGESDVVDCGIADEGGHAGFRVDLDLANVAAVGEARLRHRLVARRRERAAQVFRQVGALECCARDLEQADRMIGALDGEAAVLELDIGGGGFQQLLGDACRPWQ